MSGEKKSGRKSQKSFWQRRVVDVFVGQIKQGITDKKIALTISLGITLGIFPILGATTLLCFLAALLLKLNQPILQVVNYLVSALQLILIVVFVRIGEWLVRAPRVNFSVPELMRKFHASPKKFMQEFGMTGLHGIEGWLLVAPVLIPLLYFLAVPPLKKFAALHSAATPYDK